MLRRVLVEECAAVQALVEEATNETYGGLWAEPPLLVEVEHWARAWVAVDAATMAGVMLTEEMWVSDLWVREPFRGRGIGALLLEQGEREILERGCTVLRLRVVEANARAVAFYERQGWRIERGFRHERYPIGMLEMRKDVSRSLGTAAHKGQPE